MSEVYTDLENIPHSCLIPHNAQKLEVFEIKNKEAYIGYHVPEGFYFVQVPFTKEMGQVSDGYHTFDELYDHRIELFIALCKELDDTGKCPVWRSRLHHDGTGYGGWFIMGIEREKGKQISYHLPLSYWDATSFCRTEDRAPEWDGHTSADVLKRLRVL